MNVASAPFSLGTLVRSAAELTPSDVGKLLRQVRINRPEAIAALATPLVRLLSTVSDGPPTVVQNAGKAA